MNIYKFSRDLLEDGNIHVRKKSGDTSYIAHRHEYFEIILYQKCQGKCIINGAIYPISDSCLFLLTPKDYHKIETQDTVDAGSVIVSFSENFIDAELRAKLAFSSRVWYSPSEETVRSIGRLYGDYEGKAENRKRKLFHTLNAILCDVLEFSERIDDKSPYISPPIAKAITLILSDMSQSYTMEALAHLCGFSASYFSSLFHKEIGKSFKAWLNDTRIEYAKSLLTESTLPILDICYECGYSTPSQFIKMFKRREGRTPSTYRKKKTELHG